MQHRRIHATALILILCAVGWLLPGAGGSAHAQDRHINVIRVQDTINPGLQDFIQYAIAQSEEDSAQCLIMELDTPGGLMTAMRGIVKSIMNAKIPVVVFVAPSGAQAASAGVLITAAADVAAMAPGTNIGAAHPVTATGGDVPKTMNEKVVNDMVAFAKSIAEERGRNGQWLEEAIRKSVSVTAEEAFALNVIDLVARDLGDLLAKLDGWEVQRKGYSRTLTTKGAEIRHLEPGWRHKVLRAISNPNIAYILLMIGLAGLYFELSQPGVVLPGVIGAIALVLAFYAMQTLPVNYAGFILIALAVVFFILEIKVASYGMLSLAGITCLVLGSLMLFHVPGEPFRLALPVFIPTVLTVSAFFVGVATLAFRAQRRPPQTGLEALVGAVGVVTRAMGPGREGKVFVEGELWNAQSEEPIPEGARVEVVSVRNLKLQVKRIDDK
ncbi:membrane-bound serine protease (ClpP class) [Desulfacinum hydrothermale DSM 13146]|uniref:Membrane-bound serine protease (ClpP class) n=1 Tax=Desulfacinum hydrothermale DSM 13146 TaxID=1121390 RepID=A0A1W1X1C7_9BACT|nr:nodulation protein NfeD [Desulfacinum hydrothermale]SMC17570.1 membrane-bound serine protease (ClpP class) [Desulfacinum hydrothermale DSM 13146]